MSAAAARGSVVVVGLGPGPAELMTQAARAALAQATDIIGYGPYVDRVPDVRADQLRHASDNRVEIDRARHALRLAVEGRRVAVVSGGDPGVFAMASAVLEAVEAGEPTWRSLDIRVEPGVTAMLAAAAEAGAPLGGDFCAISLSDNLKPWATIERRLRAAADADFVIALYNPRSNARPEQLGAALALLRSLKAPQTVVLLVRAAGTTEVRRITTTLADVDPTAVDMRTLVLIGASTTRLIAREGAAAPWVYTPRREEAP